MSKSLRLLCLVFTFTCLGFFGRAALADSFDMEKDGKRYHCEQATDSGGSCWEKCPYSFASCKQECGGGEGCWAKCPYSFGSCKQECGESRGCWDKCPYSFGSCKQECGGGDGCWEKCPYSFGSCKQECGARAMDATAQLRFELGRLERVKAEAERLRLQER